jgi:hypothetical protein
MWLKIRTNDRLLRKVINISSARKAGANVIFSRGTANESGAAIGLCVDDRPMANVGTMSY